MMIFIFFAILLFSNVSVPAIVDDRSLYSQEQFQKVCDTYCQIDQKNAAIFFNIGNCFYYQKKYAEALLLWRHAQQKGNQTIFNKAQKNITDLKQELQKSTAQPSKIESILAYTRSVDLLFIQILFLIAWISILTWIVRKQRRRVLEGLLVSMIVTLAFICYDNYHTRHEIRAVVWVPRATVYVGPSQDYAHVDFIDYLEELVVLEQQEGWYRVTNRSVYGWVSALDVATIDEIIKRKLCAK